MDYADTRPDFLKQANAFSINPRTSVCQTWLHDRHVKAVLALALKWGVIAQRQYNNSERSQAVVTPTEIVGNLLGTFLDAVILEYITPIEREYE